jgi:hypothetical protein
MTSRKAAVWLDGRWYDALSRQLKKKDTTVEDVSRAVGSAHTDPAKIVAFAGWIFQPGYGIVLPAPKNNERMDHT